MNSYVDIVGQGDPLVLIHGWGMNSAVWSPLVKRLSAAHRLYIVDLPGMGQSRPVYPYTLDRLTSAIADVIPGVSNILGWSLGGLVAQQLALSQPERVNKLVLVATNPCFVSRPDWAHGISGTHFEQFNAKFSQDFASTLLNFLTLQCMHAKDTRATVRQLRHAFAHKPMPLQSALNDALQLLLQTDLRLEAERLFHPTLIMHGDRDTLAPVSAAHWLTMHMPNAQLRVIAGAAHAPFLSHADAFIDSLQAFLQAPSSSKV